MSDTLKADSPAIRPETRAMIDRLIAFDTTSRNSNLELIPVSYTHLTLPTIYSV